MADAGTPERSRVRGHRAEVWWWRWGGGHSCGATARVFVGDGLAGSLTSRVSALTGSRRGVMVAGGCESNASQEESCQVSKQQNKKLLELGAGESSADGIAAERRRDSTSRLPECHKRAERAAGC